MTKKLLLLDGFSLAFRAYYALPETMKTRLGLVSNAAYGFSNMLVKLIEDQNPSHICVAFDTPEPTYRNKLEPAYKAQRGETPETFIPQVEMIENVCRVMGVTLVKKPGAEADDIIATYSKLAFENEFETIIVTGDRDSFQCVKDPFVKVLYCIRGVSDYALYDEKGIVERTGITPSQYVYYAAMRGDVSDNLPGVKGVGEKTASQLLQKYVNIEGIYSNLEELTPRQQKLFESTKELVYKNVEMMKLMFDLELDKTLDELVYLKEYSSQAQSLFQEYSFNALNKKLQSWIINKEKSSNEKEISLLDDVESVELTKEQINLLRKANVAQYIIDPTLPQIKRIEDVDIKDLEDTLKSQGLFDLYENIEVPLIEILQKMEERGILLDVDYLKDLSVEFSNRLEIIKSNIFSISKSEFNLNSPKQLSKVLYEDLGLPILKKTKTGASTNAQTLLKLRSEHEIVDFILQYRELEKLRSTYVDVLPTLVGKDNRIHATFNQIGAITGRISSDNPNIQNIPVRTKEGRKLRKAFISGEGKKLISCDYSQIELRIMAHMANDQILIDAILAGKDVHNITAAKVFGIEENDVDNKQRSFAKAVNYGIAYGMENYGLATRLDISPKEAEEILDSYFEQFPSIHDFMNSCIESAKSLGYTETIWGRRRYLPELKAHNYMVRKQAERMAMNAPIQGTAADVMKKAIIDVEEFITNKYSKEQAELLLTVHDELILESNDELADQIVSEVCQVMQDVISLKVPLEVNGSCGKTWEEIH